MFLLPLQVFAGGTDAPKGFSALHVQQLLHTQHSKAVSLQQQQLHVAVDLMAQQIDDTNDCCSFGDDTTDLSLHADLGDETVPAHAFHFAPNLPSLTLAHGNDNVREPPFLPVDFPPPRA
ncbi:hypothetical protein [Glaciimonas sp. PCH181]|uniref:hypothetical protein n=1 Tax=Glaciimonas sp. PCH181 TaxID=2133943 RepID=UPI0011B2A05E|nr:hypothetical protein [Glaciimonas sp. PCH181]